MDFGHVMIVVEAEAKGGSCYVTVCLYVFYVVIMCVKYRILTEFSV